MKQITQTSLLVFFLLLLLSHGSAQTNKPVTDKIIGVYWSPKKDAKIEMYKKGDHYFGRSIWVASPKKDSQNPNSGLRNRSLLGLDLLTDFTYEDGIYTGGKVYDPESGKTYNCKISFNGLYMKVRGYIGVSLFGRTEIFERIL